MMPMVDDFIFFDENDSSVGIDTIEVDNVFNKLKTDSIKKEYIAASAPKKIVHTKKFYIQKNLVSLKSFREFINYSGYLTEAEKEGWGWVWNNRWIKKPGVSWKNPFGDKNDLIYNSDESILPVMQVSWNDASEYTKWLSNRSKNKFRLPCESEWELFGNYAGLNSISSVIDADIGKIDTSSEFLFELKNRIISSEFQLGLLWEWTYDWYSAYDEQIVNRDFGSIYKTLRGGSLMSEEVQKTKEFRFRRCPTARSPYYGFRMVMETK